MLTVKIFSRSYSAKTSKLRRMQQASTVVKRRLIKMNKIQRPLLRKRCLCCFTFCNSHCAGETQRFSLSVFFSRSMGTHSNVVSLNNNVCQEWVTQLLARALPWVLQLAGPENPCGLVTLNLVSLHSRQDHYQST